MWIPRELFIFPLSISRAQQKSQRNKKCDHGIMDHFPFPLHTYLYSPSFLQCTCIDGLVKFLVVRFRKALPRSHLSPLEPGSWIGHVDACLGLRASKWPFSDISDSCYAKPMGGKHPVPPRIHFPRVLITAWLCARLQATIKDRERLGLGPQTVYKVTARQGSTQETLLEKDKIRNAWQQNRTVAIVPEGQIQGKLLRLQHISRGKSKSQTRKSLL